MGALALGDTVVAKKGDENYVATFADFGGKGVVVDLSTDDRGIVAGVQFPGGNYRRFYTTGLRRVKA